MAEVAKQARRRGKAASGKAASQVNGGSAQAEEQADDVQSDATDTASSSGQTITSELKETFREAAIEVLKPVMRKATTEAAKYAVKRGPGLVKDKVAPKIQEAGGAGALAKGMASKGGGVAGAVGGIASNIGDKLPGGGGGGDKKGGDSPSGTGRGRRLPVQEFIDVGVDIQTAYDQFTQFEDWPRFMHRVESIEQRDDTTLMWHENIWGVRRSWEAEITEQEPCERIAWRSTSGPQTIGVVTFHRLSDNLTRIAITVDFQPKGLFEKTSSGMRITRRALKSDLMRFKAFIELRDEATGEWHGRIEEGEVVDQEDSDDEPRGESDAEDEDVEDEEEPEASEDEEFEDEEPEASEEEDYEDEPEASEEEEFEDEEPEASEDEEPEASEEDEPEASEDEEPEASEEDEEPKPERPQRRRRRTAAASGRARS